MLDRAGLTGPDGPTHHGVFDLTYLRPFPNLVVMAPGDAVDLRAMVEFALAHDGPTAIRYPKAAAETVDRAAGPDRAGPAEVLRLGRRRHDRRLRHPAGGLRRGGRPASPKRASTLGVINARFVKPLDTETILRAVERVPAGAHRRRRRADGRVRQRRARSRLRRRTRHQPDPPAGRPRPFRRARLPGASCWPTWASTPRGSPGLANSLPPGAIS